MKKKLLVLLLVAALALTTVAAKDAPFKVGAQLGWGFDNLYIREKLKFKSSSDLFSDTLTKYKNNGIAATVVGEYELSDNFALRANVGIMYAGKAKTSYYDKKNSNEISSGTLSEKSGLYFDAAVGMKYTLSLSKELSLSAVGGVELLTGKVYKTGNADADKNLNNLAFGLNLAGEVAYKINSNIYLNGGVSASWFMINNTKVASESSSSNPLYEYSKKINSLYFRPYVGMTYAF